VIICCELPPLPQSVQHHASQRGDKGQRQHLEKCDGTQPRKTGIPFRKSLKQKMLELKLFGLMEFTRDYARSSTIKIIILFNA